jgi:hypothetical protein
VYVRSGERVIIMQDYMFSVFVHKAVYVFSSMLFAQRLLLACQTLTAANFLLSCTSHPEFQVSHFLAGLVHFMESCY